MSPLPPVCGQAAPHGYRYAVVDSTSDEAARLLRRGALPSLAYVVAGEQTAGRGTAGRRWASPPGAGLYLSVIHTPPLEARITSDYTLAAGVTCVETCACLVGLAVRLKPVNDLFVEGCKLGGILVEGVAVGSRLIGLISGIGLNGRPAVRTLPEGSTPATSIEELLPNFRWDDHWRDRFIADLVPRLDAWYHRLLGGGREAVRRAWENYSLPARDQEGDDGG